MRLSVCGVRGSTPSPGADFVRYGGNTSCVAIAHDGAPPTLVLDGGTGLRTLTKELDGKPFDGTILIGHLHWDHTHGLPFFRAGDNPASRVSVLIPEQGDASEVMARVCSPPHFPIRIEDLQGDWSIASIEEGEHEIEGFTVLALEIPHKMSRTFGYRVSDGKSTVTYMSDHAPTAAGPGDDGLGEYHEAARRLCEGADLVIHDAQYTAADFGPRAHFGHSAVEYAIGLATISGAREVLLFHHDPERTDDQVDAIAAAHQDEPILVTAAVEGTHIDLPR